MLVFEVLRESLVEGVPLLGAELVREIQVVLQVGLHFLPTAEASRFVVSRLVDASNRSEQDQREGCESLEHSGC